MEPPSGDKTSFKGDSLSIESLGNSAEDPNGQTHHLWRYSQQTGESPCFQGSGYGYRKQSHRIPDHLPPGYPIHRGYWRLYVGKHPNGGYHRLGRCQKRNQDGLLTHLQLRILIKTFYTY